MNKYINKICLFIKKLIPNFEKYFIIPLLLAH